MSVHAVPDEPPAAPARVNLTDAFDETIAALDPPPADAAVVALAQTMARAIDRMTPEQIGMMIGQTAPQLLKILQELESRAVKRRAPVKSSRPTRVAQLRGAHAAATAKRNRTG